MPTKIFSFRLDPDLVARMDAAGEKRTEFVRRAIEARLTGLPAAQLSEPVEAHTLPARKPVAQKKNSSVPPADKPKVSAAPSGRQADAAAVLAVIRSKRLSSRQVEAEMGWLGLRYANAEKLLLGSGAAVVVDGCLVAT